MSPAARDVPAVLARHGIDPDADAPTLLAALAARGWEARVEELATRPTGTTGLAPRFRVLALRTRPPGEVTGRPGHHVAHRGRQAGGRTAAALGRVLAAVLERAGRARPSRSADEEVRR